jgi:hypothetical protein
MAEPTLSTTFDLCRQCGLSHPPLPPGTAICPMAKPKPGAIDISDIVITLTNILVSQIEIKKIKDVPKIKQYLIIEITKLLEAYKE